MLPRRFALFTDKFHTLSPLEKRRLAEVLGTKLSYLRHIAHGRCRVSLGLADALVATLGQNGELFTVEDLPLSDDAVRHHRVRLANTFTAQSHTRQR